MMKLEEIGTRAHQAEPVLRIMETEKKNRVLKKAAENLVADAETIIAANALDMEHGKEKGMSQGLLDRLFLDKSRIEAMAEGMCQVSELDDPIGEHKNHSSQNSMLNLTYPSNPGQLVSNACLLQ